VTYALARTPAPDLRWDQYCAGDWWYAPYFLNDDGSRSKFLGSYYYEHNAHRPPIMVVLPGGCEFCIDSVPSHQQNTGGAGWTVTGSPEDGTLTVDPSIKAGFGLAPDRPVREYHGFLQGNALTDDIEGNSITHAEWDAERRARRTTA
jgi:hypothetical protein